MRRKLIAPAEYHRSVLYRRRFADRTRSGICAAGRGRLVCLAYGRVESGEVSLAVRPGILLANEHIVTGSRCVTKQELAETIQLVMRGQIKPVISQRFSLEDVPKAHKLLAEGKIFGRAIMVM